MDRNISSNISSSPSESSPEKNKTSGKDYGQFVERWNNFRNIPMGVKVSPLTTSNSMEKMNILPKFDNQLSVEKIIPQTSHIKPSSVKKSADSNDKHVIASIEEKVDCSFTDPETNEQVNNISDTVSGDKNQTVSPFSNLNLKEEINIVIDSPTGPPLIPNKKLTFSILDDTIIYMVIKKANSSNSAYKAVSSLIGKNISCIQKRYEDIDHLEEKYIGLFTTLAFKFPLIAKNFGTMFNRKTGDLLQSVRLSTFNMSPVSPEIMSPLIENDFSYRFLGEYMFPMNIRSESENSNMVINVNSKKKTRKSKFGMKSISTRITKPINIKSSSNDMRLSENGLYIEEFKPAPVIYMQRQQIKSRNSNSLNDAYENLKDAFLILEKRYDINGDDIIQILKNQIPNKFPDTFSSAYSSLKAAKLN
jgi:hypothetical protein